jgi:hypothetical protein
MEVAYAFLARGGEFASDGTLSVFGGDISTVHGMTFPLQLASVTLLGKLMFEKEEGGRRYDFKVEVVGEDNCNIVPEIKQSLEVPVPGDPEKKMNLALAVLITGVQFPRPGNYRFRLLLDGQEIRSIKFEVIELTGQAQATEQSSKLLGG